MKKQKIVLFDIDHTIFDSVFFKKRLYQTIAKTLNLSKSTIEKASESLMTQVISQVGYFDPKVFSERLAQSLSNKQQASSIEKSLFKRQNFKDGLFGEVVDTIEKISKITDVGILSKGNSRFQQQKIAQLKHLLGKEHVHITVDKYKTLPKLVKKYEDKQLFIVDNNLDVLQAAKQMDKNIFTIWVKRGGLKIRKPLPDFKPDAEVKNLKKIIELVASS